MNICVKFCAGDRDDRGVAHSVDAHCSSEIGPILHDHAALAGISTVPLNLSYSIL